MNIFDKKEMDRLINASVDAYINRKLDIHEILSRDSSNNVVVDAYEYYMEKCHWDLSTIQNDNIKDFLLCISFENELSNGGIFQFFANSSGDFSNETVLALYKVNAADAAKLLEEALQFFPNHMAPKDQDERNDLMDHFSEQTVEQLEQLEQALDQIAWDCVITQNCYQFLQENKQDLLSM